MARAGTRGKYSFLESLGHGGYGTVEMWINHGTGEKICVKYPRKELDSKERDYWEKEFRHLQKLNHPNVVKWKDIPREFEPMVGEAPPLITEYYEGGNVRKQLGKPENLYGLPYYQVLRIMEDMTSAVDYIHQQKFTHRDIKPENIVISRSQNGTARYVLIDLGYLKETEDVISTVGTSQYAAPEQHQPHGYTNTVDFWGLGVVYYELSCGKRPFFPEVKHEWTRYIDRKTDNDITGRISVNGSIEFSKNLQTPNSIPSVLIDKMEHYLRLMLTVDATSRGKEKVWRDAVAKFCSFEIIKIFDVRENTIIQKDLARNDRKDISLEEYLMTIHYQLKVKTVAELRFFTARGKPVNLTDPLQQFLVPVTQSDEGRTLYMFKQHGAAGALFASPKFNLPDWQNGKQLTVPIAVKVCEHYLWDMYQIRQHIQYMHGACHVFIVNIENKIDLFRQFNEKVKSFNKWQKFMEETIEGAKQRLSKFSSMAGSDGLDPRQIRDLIAEFENYNLNQKDMMKKIRTISKNIETLHGQFANRKKTMEQAQKTLLKYDFRYDENISSYKLARSELNKAVSSGDSTDIFRRGCKAMKDLQTCYREDIEKDGSLMQSWIREGQSTFEFAEKLSKDVTNMDMQVTQLQDYLIKRQLSMNTALWNLCEKGLRASQASNSIDETDQAHEDELVKTMGDIETEVKKIDERRNSQQEAAMRAQDLLIRHQQFAQQMDWSFLYPTTRSSPGRMQMQMYSDAPSQV